jgi:hypothetical protein
MNIIFDDDKKIANPKKYGIAFEAANDFYWDKAVIFKDEKFDYNEEGRLAFGYIKPGCIFSFIQCAKGRPGLSACANQIEGR